MTVTWNLLYASFVLQQIIKAVYEYFCTVALL